MKTSEDIVAYLKSIRDSYVKAFESLEPQGKKFERKDWAYPKGKGGGEISVIRGDTFEKAAVNWSQVSGEKFPMDDGLGPFMATGVSLITHLKNPKAPTVHFNIRYIEAGDRKWLGGGFDLTPMGFPYSEDTKHFHQVAAKALAPFGSSLYEKFKENAKDYFTIKHYQRERGVGGIFFDHYHTENFDRDLEMWRSVGDHFLEAIMPIYERRIHEAYTAEDRKIQLQYRGYYVEFNLIYDRGTKFGFQSGGNPEAILCSMPPLAAW